MSWNQFAIIFGQLVVYFVNFLILGDHQNPVILKDAVSGVMSVSPESDMWSVYEGWRYMFGSEAFPAALFGLLLFCVPKTPRYLVMCGEDERAFAILEKINGRNVAGRVLEEIKQTSKEKTEKLFTYGVAGIVMGILLSVFQQAIGINAVLYYAPRIFESAGAEGGGMMQTVIMGVVNILFTLVAIFTVDRFGRKPLLIVGSIGMAVGAFAVALCDQMGIKGNLPGTFSYRICRILHDVMGADLLADAEVAQQPEKYYDRLIEIDLSALEPRDLLYADGLRRDGLS